MGPIKEILDIARGANVALMGVGTVVPERSHLVQFSSLSAENMEWIVGQSGGIGEIGGYVYRYDGTPCAHDYAARLVGFTLPELARIQYRIAIAATAEKIMPIYGALRGKYLHTLITDETAATGALDLFRAELNSGSSPESGHGRVRITARGEAV